MLLNNEKSNFKLALAKETISKLMNLGHTL